MMLYNGMPSFFFIEIYETKETSPLRCYLWLSIHRLPFCHGIKGSGGISCLFQDSLLPLIWIMGLNIMVNSFGYLLRETLPWINFMLQVAACYFHLVLFLCLDNKWSQSLCGLASKTHKVLCRRGYSLNYWLQYWDWSNSMIYFCDTMVVTCCSENVWLWLLEGSTSGSDLMRMNCLIAPVIYFVDSWS